MTARKQVLVQAEEFQPEPENAVASIGFQQEEDPVVEIYIPATDANDIVIPGLGRTVKVRQSVIDDFVTNHAPTAGLSLAKFKPRPEDIVQ